MYGVVAAQVAFCQRVPGSNPVSLCSLGAGLFLDNSERETKETPSLHPSYFLRLFNNAIVNFVKISNVYLLLFTHLVKQIFVCWNKVHSPQEYKIPLAK